MTITSLAQKLGEKLTETKQTITTAESCTGGMIAASITEVPGSSQWFHQGFITYSNLAKQQILMVPEVLINEHGAVSEAVVRAMLLGALQSSHANLGVAISGIAGPSGGSAKKPVGTVCIAFGSEQQLSAGTYMFDGDRRQVRALATESALNCILAHLESS